MALSLSKGALGDNFWVYACKYATNQIMLAGFHFGPDSDLTGFAPYVSLVAYHNSGLPKNSDRASLGLYLGPRRELAPALSTSCPFRHLVAFRTTFALSAARLRCTSLPRLASSFPARPS